MLRLLASLLVMGIVLNHAVLLNEGKADIKRSYAGADSKELIETYATQRHHPSDIESPELFEVFLRGLNAPDRLKEQFDPAVISRHLDALAAVVSDDREEQLGIGKAVDEQDPSYLARGTGDELLRWWRRKDPFPATGLNERILEHLQRTRVAFQQYARENNPNRLDDRGRMYVRLGPPDQKREIDGERRGEFWMYGLHPAAEYVFVRNRGVGYELGKPLDLAPRARTLRGQGPTRRGMRVAVRALSRLKDIYQVLAHYRSRYGIVLSDISMYLERVRERRRGLASPLDIPPHAFLNETVADIRQREAEATRRRDQAVPQTQTRINEGIEELPLATRFVRTLSEEGSTEVDIYWSIPPFTLESLSTLAEPEGEETNFPQEHEQGGYLLTASVIQFGPSYERLDAQTSHLLATDEQVRRTETLDPQRETLSIETGQHAALQLDASRAVVEEESVRPERLLKTGTVRADSLESLRSDPSQLEMSDLKPVFWETQEAMALEEAPVYPFDTMPIAAPLVLAFEIYHLTFDGEDRTRYTVEYEVKRRTERGWFSGLFRGDDEDQTAVASTVRGYERRTEEYITLDPENWVDEDHERIRVTVRVTDEVSRQTRERTIAFDLISDSQ